MNEFKIIDLGWNCYNGVYFSLLQLDIGRFDGKLLGISWGWKAYFHIDVLFFTFEIHKSWYTES